MKTLLVSTLGGMSPNGGIGDLVSCVHNWLNPGRNSYGNGQKR